MQGTRGRNRRKAVWPQPSSEGRGVGDDTRKGRAEKEGAFCGLSKA